MIDLQNGSGVTPLIKQYIITKQEHPDAIVLFQVGDFYELFFEDAKKVSAFLGITLTKRGQVNGEPIPLCGFPVHAIDHYIPRLVKGGFKLALCDQLEPAVTGKMVARGVTSVLTPGMLISDNLLDAKSNSYLFSFFPTRSGYGLLFSELLTSQLHGTVIPSGAFRQLESELFRFLPDEVLLLGGRAMSSYESFFKQRGFFTTSYGLNFDQALIDKETVGLKSTFDGASFDELEKQHALLYATILWKKYVQKTQPKALANFNSIVMYEPEAFLMLDGATQKNLEITKNSIDGGRAHTLFSVVDKAETSMGSRMIKRWLLSPLMDKDIIFQRQRAIASFLSNPGLLSDVRQLLTACGDMQRIIGRIALDKGVVRDYSNLAFILIKLPEVKNLLTQSESVLLQSVIATIKDFEVLQLLLTSSCDDEDVDSIIKTGFHEPLDRMKDLVANGSVKILEMEREEITRTGITSLKIRSNGVQGYFIEITKTNLDSIPDDYIEQQALANRKRFTTKALQALQLSIIQAQLQCSALEKEVFQQVKDQVRPYLHDLRIASQAVATIDGIVGLSLVAHDNGWISPDIGDDRNIIIKQGRHPVVQEGLQDKFIANDTQLTDDESLWIVTGPNMGGKSTYLRQVALICLLAQTGSYVPARSAKISILDRIFTRIGAGDFLAQGKSTFLVEMEETAQILQCATSRSLVILDEVGRGTSTYDGLALAQAIVEYIFNSIGARCLFATHYHELTDLQSTYHGIVSYYADSLRTPTGILFLHKIVPGKADGSFGLEVAKLAHIPQEVINRASDILSNLHENSSSLIVEKRSECLQPLINKTQVSRVDLNADLLVKRIRAIDFDNLSPRQAFELLWDLKSLTDMPSDF